MLAAWPGDGWAWTASRWSPAALALTHLLTLGYLGLVMLGSLTQMLPVVAGVPMPALAVVSRVSHGGLFLGTPLLSAGMLTLAPPALLAGTLLAGGGLAVFATAAGIALLRARPGPTVQAMRLAGLGLLVLLALGTWLAAWLAGRVPAGDPAALTDAHAMAGLVVWVAVLVVGVSYQVVPMLQVTPNYPARFAGWLVWAIPGLALAWGTSRLTGWPTAWLEGLVSLALVAHLAAHAMVTLDLQRRRRRALRDPTLDYWRLAMVCLLAACALAALGQVRSAGLEEEGETLLGILFLLGFAAGVINGLLFKIVPFLAWFHLSAQVGMRRTGVLNMKDFIADAPARRQFRLHLAALVMLAGCPWLPWLALPGGLVLAGAAGYLGWLLWRAARRFRAEGGQG